MHRWCVLHSDLDSSLRLTRSISRDGMKRKMLSTIRFAYFFRVFELIYEVFGDELLCDYSIVDLIIRHVKH